MIEGKKQNLANDFIATTTQLVNAMNDYKKFKADYDGIGAFTEGDTFTDGITLTDIVNVITSLGAVDTFVTANFHSTNFYKVINQ